MTEPTARAAVVYDAIDAFQRTHRLPGLQHAQIRGLLAEHLARVLPLASSAGMAPATDRAGVAAVRALHQQYAFGDDPQDYCAHCNQITGSWIPWPCPTILAVDAAVATAAALEPAAVLPAPADRATVLQEAADAVDHGKQTFPETVRSGASWAARMLRRMAAEFAPALCAECGHPEAVHEDGEDPVSPGRCTACPDDGEEWHDWEPADTGHDGGETEGQAPPVCQGFVWIGQPFTTCERCGQPAWEHDGEEIPVEGAGPFDNRRTVRPWKPGQADAIRAKWAPEQPAAAQQPKEA